jgi:hypothetical protein
MGLSISTVIAAASAKGSRAIANRAAVFVVVDFILLFLVI